MASCWATGTESLTAPEVDRIPTWHAAHCYGKGPTWTRDFVHDLTGWPGFLALLAMRDLAQISGPLHRAPTLHPTPAHYGK
jgi:hypothetical protein